MIICCSSTGSDLNFSNSILNLVSEAGITAAVKEHGGAGEA
jgi:hypothetical protein